MLAAQLSAARDDPARDRLSLISTLVREACIVQIDPRLDFQSQGKPDLYRPTCDTAFSRADCGKSQPKSLHFYQRAAIATQSFGKAQPANGYRIVDAVGPPRAGLRYRYEPESISARCTEPNAACQMA